MIHTTPYTPIQKVLNQTKFLFQRLLFEYKVCLKCILKLYHFDYPKLYSDTAYYIQLIGNICSPETLLHYNAQQCCFAAHCWLCEGIFQSALLTTLTKEIIMAIKQKQYTNSVYKLNIRVPHIIALRQMLFARFIYAQLKAQGKQQQRGTQENKQNNPLKTIFNSFVVPLQAKRALDAKTVMKWVLSSQLNSSTGMTSTADDHADNLTISIQLNYSSTEKQNNLMKLFQGSVPLTNHKKRFHGERELKTTASNIQQIMQMTQEDVEKIIQSVQIQPFLAILGCNRKIIPVQIQSNKAIMQHTIALLTQNLYFCGKYIKYSRYLSQTPWIVHGKKLTQGSLQQSIQDKIFNFFYPNKQKEQIQIKFHSGGRQDIDVRMLKGGRPFVLQFMNPIRRQIPLCQLQPYAMKYGLPLEQDIILEHIINYQNPYVQVREWTQTSESYISRELKMAQQQKIKHYLCYVHCERALTNDDVEILAKIQDLTLLQQTPIRVMHRRSLIVRNKVIHKVSMHLLSKHSAVLEVWASAGTYIKQFIHGDLGRTNPNLGGLLAANVDILQLDVGSLKEGVWQKGDQLHMKMDKMQWMD